ncbi:MAG TPA: ATP-binding protein [Gemmataceae bacterium]|jgi:serine/threonine-protein kinase RsbW
MITNFIIEANNHGPSQTTIWRTLNLRYSEEIPPTIEEILEILDDAGYSSKEKFAVRLSLEEALLNAVKHGHKGDPKKEVQLRYQLTPDYLLAEIEDQGPGFNPEDVADPFTPENQERAGGRGLLLMRNYMTWVEFNDTGNCVTMCRRRSKGNPN